jgi:hypothetical protein
MSVRPDIVHKSRPGGENTALTVEVRFSVPLSCFEHGKAEQFRTEYVLKSGGNSMPMAHDMASESKVLASSAFKEGVRELLSEFARYVEDYDIS